jgi:hypothetical protein
MARDKQIRLLRAERAKRLDEAREKAGLTIRGVQKQLEAWGIPSMSYGTVHAIFRGRTPPSFEFVHAFAALAGRSSGWLAFGERAASELGPKDLAGRLRPWLDQELLRRDWSREERAFYLPDGDDLLQDVRAAVIERVGARRKAGEQLMGRLAKPLVKVTIGEPGVTLEDLFKAHRSKGGGEGAAAALRKPGK